MERGFILLYIFCKNTTPLLQHQEHMSNIHKIQEESKPPLSWLSVTCLNLRSSPVFTKQKAIYLICSHLSLFPLTLIFSLKWVSTQQRASVSSWQLSSNIQSADRNTECVRFLIMHWSCFCLIQPCLLIWAARLEPMSKIFLSCMVFIKLLDLGPAWWLTRPLPSTISLLCGWFSLW